MRVRIQHDGKNVGGIHAYVTNAETGELIDYVQSVELEMQATNDPVIARITVAVPVLDIIADAEIKHVCPCCGSPQEDEEPQTPFIGQD